jgi:hypothetical protein
VCKVIHKEGKMKSKIILMFFVFMNISLYASTIHVPSDQPFIQAGIDSAVNGDTVLVATGIFTGANNKNIDFGGKSILLISEKGADSTIIDCQDEGRGFYFHSGEGYNSIIKGFTIRNGSVGPDCNGGGIFCSWTSPSIFNCIIDSCSAERGAGIACDNASPIIDSCYISNSDSTRATLGGGIYCSYSSPEIRNTQIIHNITLAAGICLEWYSSPLIHNCNISLNEADDFGIIDCYYSCSPTITNTIISNNIGNGIMISNYCELDLTNCLIVNNDGDGLWASTLNGGSADVTNCTIANNEGRGLYIQDTPVIIVNSIIYFNKDFQIYLWSPPIPQISFSNIEDKDSGGIHGSVSWGDGTMDKDPLFIDTANTKFRLSPESPCNGAGSPTLCLENDIEGNLRPNPICTNGDLGPYESMYPLNNSPYIINPIDDRIVNEDFNQIFIAYLNNVFDDVETSTLIFNAVALTGGINSAISNDSLYIFSEPDFNGSVDIVVTATDACFSSVSDTFSVVVLPAGVIEIPLDKIPSTYFLADNYPDPFNSVTTIEYSIPKKSDVTITVYSPVGQVVDVLVNQTMEPGHYSVQFDASKLGSGVYFYKIQAGCFSDVKKCTIIR